MLRTIIAHDGKLVLGGFKTAGAYATGMGVTKDEATGVVTIPAEETGANLYVLDKERIPTGANAARVDMSDYDPDFNTFAAGELCKIQGYVANEKFAVDQFDATKCIAGNAGKYAAVGTDGKWTIAGADTDSEYVFLGLHNDAGHTLALIECVKAVASTEAKSATFNNDKTPGCYIIYGDTVWKDTNDTITAEHFKAYKAMPQKSFSITYQGSGDPLTFEMTFDLMEDEDGNVYTSSRI